MNLEEHYQEVLLEHFTPAVLPFFETVGSLDIGKWPQIDFMDRLLTFELSMMEKEDLSTFCSDGIVPVQIEVQHNLIKFWGNAWWIDAPNNYPRNKSGKDPFYAEIRKRNGRVCIPLMLFGDYGQLQLDKYYWPDMDIEWIFEITR